MSSAAEEGGTKICQAALGQISLGAGASLVSPVGPMGGVVWGENMK